MKRSKMIEIIEDTLSAFDSNFDSTYCTAFNILTDIEEAGMLPPYSNPKKLKGYDIAYASPEELHQWEKEDE